MKQLLSALREIVVGYPCGMDGCWRRRFVRSSNHEMLGYCRIHLEELIGVGFEAKLDMFDRRFPGHRDPAR